MHVLTLQTWRLNKRCNFQEKKTIESQRQEIYHQNIRISSLERSVSDQANSSREREKDCNFFSKKSIADLENRIKSQEQHSRRTRLRFNNVPVPTDAIGNIQHPVDTNKH